MENVWKAIKKTKQYIYLSSLGIGFWSFIILTFLFGFISIFFIEELSQFMISDLGYFGIFIMVLIIELLLQPTGPDLIIMLGLLTSLNPWILLFVVILSVHISFFIAYIVGKKIGMSGVEKITSKKSFERIASSTAKSGKWFMLISAISPVPYVPYLAGVWYFNTIDNFLFVLIPRTIRLFIVFSLSYFLGIKFLEISIGMFL